MAIEVNLTANVTALLDWEVIDTDKNISMQFDRAINTPRINYTYGSGVDQINQAWYAELTVPSGADITINLLSLPTSILNMNITKSFSSIKSLIIENISPSGMIHCDLDVTNPIEFLPMGTDIGYSGVYTFESRVGVPVSASKYNFRLVQTGDEALAFNWFDINFKILILGLA